MSYKISPIEVLKKTLSICWVKNSLVGMAVVGAIISSFVYTKMMQITMDARLADPSSFPSDVLYIWVFHTALTVVFLTFSCHLAVTVQRGDGVFVPKPFLRKLGAVLGRFLIILLLIVVAIIPMVGLEAWLSPDGQHLKAPFVYLFLPIKIIVFGALYSLFLRVGLMIPGAAAGEKVTIASAFTMSKGYSMRMLLSIVMIVLPMLLLVFIITIMFARISLSPMALLPLSLFIGYLACIAIGVCISVWYEKLRLRHEDALKTEPQPETT